MKKIKTTFSITIMFFVLVVFVANISGLFMKPNPSGGFPYIEYASRVGLPGFLRFLTNFDGTQYLIIAESGYYTYQQAYFPLYPSVSNLLGKAIFGGNVSLAMVTMSILSLALALWLLGKVFRDKEFGHVPKLPRFGPYFLLLLPGSFFFVAAYTESVFLLLLLASIYFAKRSNFFLALTSGFLLGTTRLMGFFGLVPLFFAVYNKRAVVNHNNQISPPSAKLPRSRDDAMQYLKYFIVVSPVLGLLVYMIYLYITTGDPLAFISSQQAFNNNRSTSLVFLPQVIYRYLRIFLTVKNYDTVYFVSILEFVMFGIYSALLVSETRHLWRIWKKGGEVLSTRFSLLIFSVINLILPTLTGTLSSIPRYGLLSISIIPAFFALNKKWQILLAILFSTLNIVMLALFAQGWFVS